MVELGILSMLREVILRETPERFRSDPGNPSVLKPRTTLAQNLRVLARILS